MYSSIVLSMITEIIIAFLSQSISLLNLTSLYNQWMNSLSNIVYGIQTMSTQSNNQCPNCKHWFPTQKSFKHHIRHYRRTNCEEKLNDLGISAANPLLSNFTPGVETNTSSLGSESLSLNSE